MHNQAGKQAPTYAGRLADTAVNSALQCAKRIMHGEPELLLLFMGELTSAKPGNLPRGLHACIFALLLFLAAPLAILGQSRCSCSLARLWSRHCEIASSRASQRILRPNRPLSLSGVSLRTPACHPRLKRDFQSILLLLNNPNQVVRAWASPCWVWSPTHAAYPSGLTKTAVGP